MKRFIASISLCLVTVLLVAPTAHAQAKFKGLTISPVNQEVTVKAGKQSAGKILLSNHSKQDMTVRLYVQQFSAVNRAYDLKIEQSEIDWVTFDKAVYTIAPGEKTPVFFTAAPPQDTPPGGYYFALTASVDFGGKGIKKIGEVISQLYVTVDGKLVRKGKIENPSVPFVVFDNSLKYKYDVRNEGNTHFVAVFFGELDGWFTSTLKNRNAHVVLPDTVRTVTGVVSMPVLPGIYAFHYGYQSEAVDSSLAQKTYVLFIPPWSLVALLLLLLIGLWVRQKNSQAKKVKSED